MPRMKSGNVSGSPSSNKSFPWQAMSSCSALDYPKSSHSTWTLASTSEQQMTHRNAEPFAVIQGCIDVHAQARQGRDRLRLGEDVHKLLLGDPVITVFICSSSQGRVKAAVVLWQFWCCLLVVALVTRRDTNTTKHASPSKHMGFSSLTACGRPK